MRLLARELDSLRDTIAGPLAAAYPRAAVAQMRLLLSMAENVFERSDDGSSILGEAFRQAGAELGRLWALLPARDPVALAGEVLAKRYPAAAMLLHRTLAEDVLRRAFSLQYQYATRDVRSCEGLAPFLPDEAGLETHKHSWPGSDASTRARAISGPCPTLWNVGVWRFAVRSRMPSYHRRSNRLRQAGRVTSTPGSSAHSAPAPGSPAHRAGRQWGVTA